MLINGNEFRVDDLIKDLDFEKYKYQNNKLGLTAYQVSVLERYNIDCNALSLKELIYLIHDILNENEDNELELILENISEKDYYENTRK